MRMPAVEPATRVFAAAAALLGLAGLCWYLLSGPGEARPARAPDRAHGLPAVTFTDRTLARAAGAAHRQGDDHLTGLDESLGSGACALDYDRDGWIDLFTVNGSGDTRYYGRRHWWQRTAGHSLLRNVAGVRFEDVTQQAIALRPTRGFGCLTADFDNDGHADIFISGIDENVLLRNLGNGKFLDVTAAAGLKGHGWQTAAAAADVDGDGLLDLYVGRFVQFQKGAHTYEPGSQYKQDVSGSFNSALYPAQANSLYRNLGGFKFEDVTQQAGVANADGRTLGALWFDIDRDERPDLIVANAAGTGSTAVFQNRGKWRFTALGAQTRLQTASGARAFTLADLNNDGAAEIVLTAGNGAQSAIFVQGSDVSFVDRGRQWGFAKDEYSGFSPWGAVAADFNNDGWLDVLVGNGLAIPDPDVPRLTVGQPKQLWLNSGAGALEAVTLDAHSPLADRQSARGLVTADFDNDGDMDVYVAHNNDLGQLLVNESPRGTHWVGVQLIDTRGNRDAVGSRVELTTAQGVQHRWIVKGSGFLSDGEPRLHFGLGDEEEIKRIVVTWPDGGRSTYRKPAPGAYLVLERGEPARSSSEQRRPPSGNYPSLAHGREPQLRAEYIRLLAAARGMDGAIDEIALAVADSDASVRRSVVDLLAQGQSSRSLAVLLDLLADPDAQVAQAAVQAVCRYEDEGSVRWLLRLFSHAASTVRGAVADCFAFYFQEEEAVLHRKYLALPYLIERLQDADESVQIAAARALGNAERFRGVPPLIELAGRTVSVSVRAEAIRAVGLIRDKHATVALVDMLGQPATQAEPQVLAQVLIALRRLDYPSLPQSLRDLAAGQGQFSRLNPRARLTVLRELLAASEAVVLGRDTVAGLVERHFRSLAHSDTADEATLLILLDVLRESAGREAIALLDRLARAGRSAAVRVAALRALVALDAANAGRYVEAAILSGETQVAQRMVDGLAGHRVELSSTALDAALGRSELRESAFKVCRRLRTRGQAQLALQIAADATAPVGTRAAALQALGRSPFNLELPASLYASRDDALGVAVVSHEMSRLPPLVVSRQAPAVVEKLLSVPSQAAQRAALDALAARPEFWAKSTILAVLKDSSELAVRRHILSLIARDTLQGSGMLEVIATDRADPLRLDALRHLEGREGSSAEQLLMKVLSDRAEPAHIRIVAAHRLVGRLGPEVLQLLEQS